MDTWEYGLVNAGCKVSQDRSGGQGHCWVPVRDSIDCPISIQEEIAAEIIDGKQLNCSDYCATNGHHYRWEQE